MAKSQKKYLQHLIDFASDPDESSAGYQLVQEQKSG